jgi:hypothetical protein
MLHLPTLRNTWGTVVSKRSYFRPKYGLSIRRKLLNPNNRPETILLTKPL